jgi:hypothetical protein
MSPKAERSVVDYFDHALIPSTAGDLEPIKEQIQEALEAGEYSKAKELIGQLEGSKLLNERLQSNRDELLQILRDAKKSEVYVPWELTRETEEQLDEELTGQSRYIKDVRPKAAMMLIELDDDGSFTYENPARISDHLLAVQNPSFEDKRLARIAFRNARNQVKRNILFWVDKYGSHLDMAGLINSRRSDDDKRGGREQYPEWEPFYDYLINKYGDRDPKDFIKNVIRRGIRDESDDDGDESKKYDPIKATAEIIASNRLLDPKTRSDIRATLGIQRFDDIVDGMGYGNLREFLSDLDKARKESAEKRGNRTIENVEEREALDWIRKAISNNEIGKSRTLGMKFLERAIQDLGSDIKKISDLVRIIHPYYRITTDGQLIIVDATNVK